VNRFALVAALLLGSGGLAAAQTAAPSPAPAAPAPDASAPANARHITLPEAISIATDQTFQVLGKQDEVDRANAKLEGDKSYRLPTFSISGGVQVWNKEIAFALAPPPEPATVVRSQVTGSVTAQVAENITGAVLLKTLLKEDEAQIDIAKANVESTKLTTAYQVISLYLAGLQTQTLREIAETGVKQIEADLTEVKALRDAKVLADVDVLRVEAAKAAREQQVLDAETQADAANTALVLALGLPGDTTLALEPIDLSPMELPWSEADAVAAAQRTRPEKHLVAAGVAAADRGVDLAKGAYLPMLSAVGNYTHAEGQGVFAEKDSAFVGVNLQWNVWDWGKRHADLEAARSSQREAKRGADAMVDIVAADVHLKYRAAVTKRKSLDVAEAGLKAAEEAYRLQQVKISAGASTTTDVIDAETAVAQSRAAATIARYQYLAAWMDAIRAVGQLPDMPAASK
jgi:outer membrane protein